MSDNSEDKIKEFATRLKIFEEQFASYSKEIAISQPNYESSTKINAILFEKDFYDENNLLEIKRLVDWTERKSHWEGASWFDYKLHVKAYLGFKGIKINLP